MNRKPRTVTCEATAYANDCGHAFALGSYLAASPRLALRWLRRRTRDIIDQLDPAVSRPARAWLHDTAAHERALDALARGRRFTVAISDDGVRYRLTAHPHPSPQTEGSYPARPSGSTPSGPAPETH